MQKIGIMLLLLPYFVPLILASIKILGLLVKAIALNDYLNYLFLGILIPIFAVEVYNKLTVAYGAGELVEAAGYVVGLGALLGAAVTIQRLRDKMKSVVKQD